MTPEAEDVLAALDELQWTERWSAGHRRRHPRGDPDGEFWELLALDDEPAFDASAWYVTVDCIRGIEARVRRRGWTIPVVDSFPCATR